MKLAFSNIAWRQHDDPETLSLLKEKGVAGIEVAPTKIWPNWEGATPSAAEQYGRWLRGYGFEVPAMQAVLFGKPQAQLFGADDAADFIAHLEHVAELAQALGAGVVVWGAPRQRDRGTLTMAEAYDVATGILYRLARMFAARGSCLCIEPNPRRYGCNFVINADEGAELVRRVNHPGFALHLDSAGMFLEADQLRDIWPRAGHLVRHFHISEPDLADFRTPQVPHRSNIAFLESASYPGWCSVEMREPTSPLALVGPWSLIQLPE